MKLIKNKRYLLLILCAVLLIAIVVLLFVMGNTNTKKEKIGFIITGSTDEGGWNGMHYAGVSAACEELGVELVVKENIIEFSGECGPATEELVREGCKMIILTSFGYAEEIKDIIQKNPDVSFYGSDFSYLADNVTSYFTRMYQARYLAGIVAGMQTKTNNIGYVAAKPNCEVNRGINAFTLGVRRVNPDATVTVAWTGSWDNEEKERKLADALIEEAGVDVITYHQNRTYTAEEAEKHGVYSIGYHQSLEQHSDKFLGAVICDWKLTYETIIRQYLQGKTSDIKMYWVGMEENVVRLSDLSPLVSEETKAEITKAQNDIISGQDVFSGVIYDNEGKMRCKENQTIRDEIILKQFTWYVEGVKFYD